MSRAALMADLQTFIGHAIIECEDKIEEIAKLHKYSVLVKGFESPRNLDNDESRLNVRTNRDGVVISFSIG
jgi:hypothetical protein